MKDTDRRPSVCPECGRLRNAAKYPVCTNYACSVALPQKRYVWVSASQAKIILNPAELLQNPDFDREKDFIYRLGEEIEVKVTVEVKNKKPLYRENARGYHISFENRD
jgi:hypothetical protein